MDQATVDRLIPPTPATHRVVLLSGKQGSGKTTLAGGLAHAAQAAGMAIYRTRFARVLYEIHDEARRVARKYGVAWPEKYGRFLQLLGTELGRDEFGEDVWVDACRGDVERHLHDATRPTLVLIDDMRFPNEFRAFAGSPWPVSRIRLMANESARRLRTAGWRDATDHPSEVALDSLEASGAFDLALRTDVGSASDALATVAEFLGIRTPDESARLGLRAAPTAGTNTLLSNGMEIAHGNPPEVSSPSRDAAGAGAPAADRSPPAAARRA